MATFDISKLVLGEIAKIEELSGTSINAMGGDNTPKGKMLAAMAFVYKKREDPKYTWNDALGLTIDEANEILGLNEDENAEEPAPLARGKKAAATPPGE